VRGLLLLPACWLVPRSLPVCLLLHLLLLLLCHLPIVREIPVGWLFGACLASNVSWMAACGSQQLLQGR
jgi:hypothetical protein